MPEQIDSNLRQLVERGNGEKLLGYGLDYFEQLKTEWSLIPDPLPNMRPAAMDRLNAIFTKNRDQLTWDDLYTVEKLFIHAAPLERLKRMAWALRQEYKDAVGDDRYQIYLKALPPPADGTDEAALRADLDQIQAELQWTYSVQPVVESLRTQLTQSIVVIMGILVTLVVIANLLVVAFYQRGIPAFSWVIFTGALGASFSAQRRIQSSMNEGEGNALLNIMRSSGVKTSVIISPVIGALSAVALAFLFASKLLDGALFPHISLTQLPNSMPLFGKETNPVLFDGGLDLAKLVVWSFIAGFAERLVPDTLQRLAESAQNDKTTGK